MAQVVEIKVLARLYKSRDVETHVREIFVQGVRAVELRDYIPSSDRYGRGYWVPEEMRKDVAAALAGED